MTGKIDGGERQKRDVRTVIEDKREGGRRKHLVACQLSFLPFSWLVKAWFCSGVYVFQTPSHSIYMIQKKVNYPSRGANPDWHRSISVIPFSRPMRKFRGGPVTHFWWSSHKKEEKKRPFVNFIWCFLFMFLRFKRKSLLEPSIGKNYWMKYLTSESSIQALKSSISQSLF